MTAPAVALLLNATSKSAFAQIRRIGSATSRPILDDFTFGNNEEDIDATNSAATSIPTTGQRKPGRPRLICRA